MRRPNLDIGRGIEEVGLDANTIVGTLHTAFQKVTHAKSMRHLAQVKAGKVAILGYGRLADNL